MLIRTLVVTSLAAGCAVSAPTLLTCQAGQAAIAQGDGGWSCQNVPTQAQLTALQQQVASLEESLGGRSDGGSSESAGLLTQTTGPLTLYVRLDGSDTACNGQSDTAASGNTPDCAVQSLQQALDLVPVYISQTVTITLGAGTFTAPAGASSLAHISKLGRSDTGSLTIAGSSTGTTLEASSGTLYGLEIGRGGIPVTLQNLTLTGFSMMDILVTTASVTLNNVTCQQGGDWGLFCNGGATCLISGNSSFNNNETGVGIGYGGFLEVETGASVTMNGNSNDGLEVLAGCELEIYGDVTITNSGNVGLAVFHGSAGFIHDGAITIAGNAGPGIQAEGGAELDIETSGMVSVTVPSGGGPGIQAVNGAVIVTTVTSSLDVSCESSASSIGVEADNHSGVDLQGAGSVSVASCGTGLHSNYFSYVRDLGTGLRSDTSDNAYVNNAAIFVKGAFPDEPTCAAENGLWCE